MAISTDTAIISSPIGHIIIRGNAAEIQGLRIDPRRSQPESEAATDLIAEAVRQLGAYFDGNLRDFDLSLSAPRSLRGAALRAGIIAVPYGDTATYGEVAKRTDSGPRAVGQACRTNPFPIIVPCHRIISASGPEHYSGGDGVKTKAWLIAHEARHSQK